MLRRVENVIRSKTYGDVCEIMFLTSWAKKKSRREARVFLHIEIRSLHGKND